MSTKPKVTLAPFMTAKRKAPPVEEPEEIEDEEDQDDTVSSEREDLGDEDKEPRYHDDPPGEPIEEREDDQPKCIREGCKYDRTPSPRKPEYRGLCKYHSDQVRLQAQRAEKVKPKRRKRAESSTPADKLGRLLAVVERLGGLEAAEKLAEVLNGLH